MKYTVPAPLARMVAWNYDEETQQLIWYEAWLCNQHIACTFRTARSILLWLMALGAVAMTFSFRPALGIGGCLLGLGILHVSSIVAEKRLHLQRRREMYQKDPDLWADIWERVRPLWSSYPRDVEKVSVSFRLP